MVIQAIQSKETHYKTVYKWTLCAYLALCAALCGYHLIRGDWYLAAQSVLSMLLSGLPAAVCRAVRLRRVYRLDVIALAFIFLAHTLGTAAAFYYLVPMYDKIMHALSGTLTMMLALPLFYYLKRPHRVESGDAALAITFCVVVTLAVAGLWEIVEYWISAVTGIDTQAAVLTGVTDTMQDMMVCLLGSLAVIPTMLRYYRRDRAGFVTGGLVAFVALNFIDAERVDDHEAAV